MENSEELIICRCQEVTEQEILDAIRDRDADRAEELIREHLDRWFMNEEKLRAQHPEFFKETAE